MRIPAVDLRPALEETRACWQARVGEVFGRMHFILGEEGVAFEAEFAREMGAKHAVGCGNGTAAIELCLRDAGITSAKQEVLTTPLTAPFTGVGIAAAGARPRFADVDPRTLLLDPGDAGNRLTRRTAALVAVHLYGMPCAMERLRALCRGRSLVLIQDAAQAHGATYRGRPLTAWSRYVTYSFYPTKNLGCLGDGGAIATGSRPAAARLRARRDGGRVPGSADMVSRLEGINSRLDELQACFLRAFLPRLAGWNAHRARVAALYREALADCAGVELPQAVEGGVQHLFPVLADGRDRLRAFLRDRGIGSGVHYPVPLHLHPAFRDCGLKRGDLPVAERACRRLVSLPLWSHLPLEQAAEAAEAVRAFYRSGIR